MDTNLEMPPNKDSNSNKLKTKRKELKNKKLHMKDSATYAKKSLEINSKKYKFHKDSTNPHAPSLPANTDGQPTCKES